MAWEKFEYVSPCGFRTAVEVRVMAHGYVGLTAQLRRQIIEEGGRFDILIERDERAIGLQVKKDGGIKCPGKNNTKCSAVTAAVKMLCGGQLPKVGSRFAVLKRKEGGFTFYLFKVPVVVVK